MYHPDEYREPDQSSSFSDDQVAMSERQQSEWQKLLTLPDPLPAITLKPKRTARVLTGPEFLQQVKGKELKKKEKALKKEERTLAREKKAKDWLALLEKKARQQEEKMKKIQHSKFNQTNEQSPRRN